MRGRRARILLVATLAVAAAGAAAADELVTRDGQVIQTRGPWEVRGRLLVFRLMDGTLASLRLDEADLEASEQRARDAEEQARRARQEAPPPQPEPAQAAFVLTDRDVARAPDIETGAEQVDVLDDGTAVVVQGEPAADSGPGEGAEEAGGADGDEPVAVSGRGVQVVQWSQELEDDAGLAVRGVIQNLGESFATSLSVNALFYDEAGSLVAAREVQFDDSPLGPGARRDFSVSLPDTLVYDEIRFQVLGRGFRTVGQSVRSGGPPPLDVPEVP